MHIIVCLDDQNAMSFGGRRQSMDRVVRQDMLENYSPLRMSSYSASQFREEGCVADEDFLKNADRGDHCFVETTPVEPYMDKVSKITVYRWNRAYPGDLYFPSLEGWRCIQRTEFAGYSHERITKEVYCR